MLTDAEIARNSPLVPITKIAKELDIDSEELELYGKYKAKLSREFLKKCQTSDRKDAKLILVTAVNPTPAGEGKTTTSIGLAQGMAKLGKKAVLALREPSQGPVFGVKGGAAGGGYSQVLPMDEINLHFTGDFHAITAANNLLCAMIDNSLQQGNPLTLNPKRILFKRVMDMNDRALRSVTVGMGAAADGVMRSEGFSITAASEVMAILCLAKDIKNLKEMLGNILVGYTYDGKAVFCRDLSAEGAMTALLKDAILPNLVQTIEHTPCLIHGGPFANIAHGCNSVIATKTALKLGDYVITEAGFGADLGAEKFFDIKCVKANLTPSAVVLVATVRALKYNGGVAKENLKQPDCEALNRGIVNLEAHIENLQKYQIPVIVAINHFYADSDEEIGAIKSFCEAKGVVAVITKGFAEGGNGAIDLARQVIDTLENKKSNFKPLYEYGASVKQKNKNNRKGNLRCNRRYIRSFGTFDNQGN